MFTSIMLLLSQAGPVGCYGSVSVQKCTGPDGSTVIERKLATRTIRKGTDSDGGTWQETVLPTPTGSRTIGQDSRGRRWYETRTANGASIGIDRFGRQYSKPALPRNSQQQIEDLQAKIKPMPEISGKTTR
jgi:hypothetical protein